MGLEILTGDLALARIGSEAFGASWKLLHARCPWATGCQHPDFVLPWYQIYHERYAPVVLVDEADDGVLNGLFTLALSPDGARLTGAGGVQAEYQGWIARLGEADRFALDAIERIRGALPDARVSLRYLPPGIPLGWVGASATMRRYCDLRGYRRPLMRIEVNAMDRLRRKKNHKQKFNRLKARGAVSFERVTGAARFERVFDEICTQYDLRQAALYRRMPFADDPLKKRFYAELQRRGMLHTTILTLDGQLVASHLGLLSKENSVHLGINTYAPAFGSLSPGHLLLALLGGCLASEQVDVLDLTPGGDLYKEQFASEHDQVFELTMFGSVAGRARGQALAAIRGVAKALLQRSGWRAAGVAAAFDDLAARARRGPAGILRKLMRAHHPRLWRAPARAQRDGAAPLPLSRNSLVDVFKYDHQGAALTRGPFIGSVMKRMENDCALFSYAPLDRLDIHCWVRAAAGPRVRGLPVLDVADGAHAMVMFDLYVHRDGVADCLLQGFVTAVLAALRQADAATPVYYAGPLDASLQAVLRRCGFDGVLAPPGAAT